jgi:hypothetical protein
LQAAERAYLGAVLVPLRQHAQEVADGFDAEPQEPFAEPRTDAGERSRGPIQEPAIGLGRYAAVGVAHSADI